MLNYRDGLASMPKYDTCELDWRIKVNANESNIGQPPLLAIPMRNTICSVNRSGRRMDIVRKTSS